MKRKVIPVLIGLLLIVLILAGAAGVFFVPEIFRFEGRSGFKRIFRAERFTGGRDCLESGADRGKGTAAG